tara:strand:- start:13648 stop:14883 length:1236 start_codon:yes stop_codon:yes gene_type:complete
MILETTIAGMIVFTGVIMALVLILNFAGNKLLPQGEVDILINEDNDSKLKTKPGSTLLSALSNQSLFLPSACGGQGTCAMCKCQVIDGGGEILPTETAYISRAEAKNNWRLACQVKIKNDMEIKIPDEVFSIKKWDCEVVSNNSVATFIKELVIDLPKGDNLDFKAGGYIQIDIPEYSGLKYSNFDIQKQYHPDWDQYKIWDLVANNEEPIFRAYSMANHPAEGNRVMLNVRIATPPPKLWNDVPPGIASSYIYSLKPGDKVTISGPYGEFFIKDTNKEMVYIGGGAGMAPMRSHLFHLFNTLKTGRKVSFWYGARSKREMFYDEEFKKIAKKFPNFNYVVALSEPLPEDKWDGATGFIHQVVNDNYLSSHEDPTELEFYMCGPPPMITACENMLFDLGVEEDQIAYDVFG